MDRSSEVSSPLVSVIIPTYGRPKYLEEALRSVYEQTYNSIEVLIIDDHSPIPAASVVDDLAFSFDNVRCIRHEENKGANAARNTGIRNANGEFVVFLDDDDKWLPETIEREVETLQQADSNVGLVTVGMRIVDEQGNQLGLTIPDVTPDVSAIDALASGSSVGSFSRIMVRQEVIAEAGLTDERLPCWQDWDWEFSLANHCQFTSIQEPLVVRRQSDHDQISDEFEPRRDVAYPLLRTKHRSTIEQRGESVVRQFESELARTLGMSGLSQGHYLSGVRYLIRALRYKPTDIKTYLFLSLAIGGPVTYKSTVWTKRKFMSHVQNI